VETSPMENLLIEHPSMSVYAVHNSCPGLSEASSGTDDAHNSSSPRYVASILLQSSLLSMYFISMIVHS
jgi:tumor protein p53-inducible nuclear protein 1